MLAESPVGDRLSIPAPVEETVIGFLPVAWVCGSLLAVVGKALKS
jgi:hypothetical protein